VTFDPFTPVLGDVCSGLSFANPGIICTLQFRSDIFGNPGQIAVHPLVLVEIIEDVDDSPNVDQGF
jgi:hypothetical protein